MLTTLIKKEILNNLLNLRFTISYFLCIALLVGSISIMVADYIAEKRNYDINNAVYMRQADGILGAPWFLWVIRYFARPPTPTKILAVGSEKDPNLKGRIVFPLSPHFYGDFRRNPLPNLFPTVDMVFIVGLILSLLVFVLAYDSIAGEREGGTLLVLLSGPVPRDLVISAKWIGGLLSLLIPFIISWLIIALIVMFYPALGFTAQDWTRFSLIAAASIAYIAVVFSISMAVSVMIRHSGTVVLSLLLIWVVFFVAVPALSTPVAQLIIKPQSVEHTEEAMNQAMYKADSLIMKKIAEEIKHRFGDKKMEQLSDQERGEIFQANSELFMSQPVFVVDLIAQEGQKQTRMDKNVDDLSRAIARFSPYGCFQNMCVTLAGTDMQRVADLNASVEKYQHTVTKTWNDYEKTGKPPYDFPSMTIPRYRFERTGVMLAVERSLPDFGVLILIGVLAVLIGYVKFIRMEIL